MIYLFRLVRKFRQKREDRRGFTLIELLIVISIIGILIRIILPPLNAARMRGRDAKRIAEVKQLQQAAENYFENNSSYPSGPDPSPLYQYLAGIPKDPNGSSYGYFGTGTTYCIGTNLENPSGYTSPSSCSTGINTYNYKVGSQ